MTKRRRSVLLSAWGVTSIAVTLWIIIRAEGVTAGNAMLVGAVTATAVTAALARVKRG